MSTDNTLTPSQMAVEIAKDVILQLNLPANPLIAGNSGYLKSFFIPADMDGDLQDVVSDVLKAGCIVCARGAAMLCKARLYDNVPLSLFSVDDDQMICGNKDTMEALNDVFDENQLQLIEAAYEQDVVFYDGEDEQGVWAEEFGLNFYDDKERMEAIMRNIIQNNGRFVPPPVEIKEEIDNV